MKNIPDRLGYYDSFHHSEYTEALKALLQGGNFARAKELLVPLLDAIEAEAQAEQFSVDPWHYRQLAQIYKREGNNAAARTILERYARQNRCNIPLGLHITLQRT